MRRTAGDLFEWLLCPRKGFDTNRRHKLREFGDWTNWKSLQKQKHQIPRPFELCQPHIWRV